MKLPFESYDAAWKVKFEKLKEDLATLLQTLAPSIDHIGSTSVEGLSAKPIIDIQLGVKNEAELDRVPILLKLPNIVYYEKYNEDMATRRFFVIFNKTVDEMKVSSVVKNGEDIPSILHNHNLRTAHIHAFVKNSEDWIRHIAFRDYLRVHPKEKIDYQNLKEDLAKQNWKDGNEYNAGKDDFLRKHEKIALNWYLKNK